MLKTIGTPSVSNSCERCRGLMIRDTVFGRESDLVSEAIPTWRCVNCGETIDALIRVNRPAGRWPNGAAPTR